MKKQVIKDPVELEKLIEYYLDNDLPLSILEDNYHLSYPQMEFLLTKTMGYSRQRDEMEEMYDTFEVSTDYLKIPHIIEEAKPLKSEEQIRLFKRLDELDDKHIIKRMNLTNDELSRHKTVLKRILLKYESQMKICDLVLKEKGKDALREIIISRGVKEKNVDEVIEMYDYYIEVKERIEELTKKRDELLRERRKMLDDNFEYADITHKLVITNVKLANWVIRDYFKNIPLPKEETQALALEGLSIAINRFDYSLGYNFSTYAFKVIKNVIKRNFKSLMGVTWITYCMKRNIAYWRSELLNMDESRVVPYSPEELANSGLVRYSAKQIRNLDEGVDVIYNFSDYYDMPDDSKVCTKGDMPMDQNDYDYLDAIDDNEGIFFEDETMGDETYYESLKKTVIEVLGTLTEREQKILDLRYGISDGKYRTLEEVGKEFFVSPERVRQQEAKALRKCRHASRREKLISFVEDYDVIAKSSSISSGATKKEIVSAFMRLYELRASAFPYSAKAFFISTRKMLWDEQEALELDLLLDAFIINLQLGEKYAYPVSSIIEAFCEKFSHEYRYKYPYNLIYDELKKRVGIAEECVFDDEVQTYLRKNPSSVINLTLKNKC